MTRPEEESSAQTSSDDPFVLPATDAQQFSSATSGPYAARIIEMSDSASVLAGNIAPKPSRFWDIRPYMVAPIAGECPRPSTWPSSWVITDCRSKVPEVPSVEN